MGPSAWTGNSLYSAIGNVITGCNALYTCTVCMLIRVMAAADAISAMSQRNMIQVWLHPR